MRSLQELADALASELRSPVGVDDRRFRALAYSAHEDEIDQVRRDSILRREAPQAVTRWLSSLGIEDAPSFVRVPANPEFGMQSRLCFPLRFEGVTMGYLWLIDDPSVGERRSLEVATDYVGQLAAELVRVRQLESAEREQQARALSALLSGDDPAAAAAQLAAEGILTGSGSFVVVLAQVACSGSADPGVSEPGPEIGVHLSLAAEEVRRGISSKHALAIARPHEVILALAFDDPDEPARRGGALLDACRRHLATDPVAAGLDIVVGIGSSQREIAGLARSYEEAHLAAEVADRGAVVDLSEPVLWEELGAYRTIAMLLGDDRDPTPMLPKALVALLGDRDGHTLVQTAEAYLDNGGDAKGTAAALVLHRSGLYKRLQRIERVTGYDLRRGDDRLELHLGLRLWRLGEDGGRSSPPRG